MTVGEGSVLKDNIVLERELGRGAMGVVWLAKNRALDSEVCVKVLHADRESDELRERFLREAKAVARVDHPHVVKIFDYGVTPEGTPFFVMERLRGVDLYGRIGETGPLALDETAAVITQAASALARAHELGVVHRDIKPANVFLLEGAGRVFVKLLDFGIAKLAGGGEEHGQTLMGLTQTASLLGTPYYMSPEQFIDPRRVDHRTDLWSLSVVAYACLLGQLPFLGASVGALSLAVHKGDFVPPTTLDDDLPEALDAWFARALHPEADRRFGDARELAETFAAALRGSPPLEPSSPAATEASDSAEPPSQPAPSQPASSQPEWGDEGRDEDPSPRDATTSHEGAMPEREPSRVGMTLGASGPVHLESSMDPVTSTRAESPGRGKAPRSLLVAGAAVVMAAIAITWLRSESEPVEAPVAPAAIEARLRVEPPQAEVRVNGVARAAPEGVLMLRGQPGDSFVVELALDDRELERTVFITRDGSASIERLVLPPAASEAPPREAPEPPEPLVTPSSPPPRAPPAVRPPPPSTPSAEPPPPVVPPSRDSWD